MTKEGKERWPGRSSDQSGKTGRRGSMRGGWVYIMTNRRGGVIYTGVTADLRRRMQEHRLGIVKGFTARYRLIRLVYYEGYDEILAAIQREKNIKHWPRAWKVMLIEKMNPSWSDLVSTLNA